MGESTLVVGDSNLVKVHVHVPDPGVPISYGVRLGVLSDVVVENLDEQSLQFSTEPKAAATEELTGIAIVSVVPGEGLMRIFESMGASAIVQGGQTMNPSTQQILDAINSVNANRVLVLPNNRNVILAAKQAQGLTDKDVEVVPTKTVPQGIGALMAFNYQGDLQDNVQRMVRGANEVHTVEVTRAVRTTQINGLKVHEGDIIGLLNDELVATGPSFATVALNAMAIASVDQDYELSTVYFGQDVTQDEADSFAAEISSAYPELEVDVYDGGQAHYHYILSLE
jgi:dihydroxyacetone kinase-like predicted kinase